MSEKSVAYYMPFYRNFCAIKLNDSIKSILDGQPGAADANYVLAYGYVDHEAGFTFEIMAAALVDKDGFRYKPVREDCTLKLRADSFDIESAVMLPDDEGELAKVFSKKLELLTVYAVSDEVEESRKMRFLDPCRHETFVDDVQVHLRQRNRITEVCWVRITGLGDHYFIGTLMNEPDQNFGWHKGDNIAFFLEQTDDGGVICYTDMNPPMHITEEDLADGSMLREAIKKFNEESTEDRLVDALVLLRDSYVWIPCRAIFSEEDQKRFNEIVENSQDDLESLIDTKFTAQDEVRFVPDVLTDGEEFFFPVFSSAEEMGEYGNDYSKIQCHILEAIVKAKNNDKKVKGIVIDPYSERLILPAEMFEVIEKMKSSIENNTPESEE